MTDIVERLLADNSYDVREAAAEEIERLRGTINRLMEEKLSHMDRIWQLHIENENLKKEMVEK